MLENNHFILGVDIGGTHISAALVQNTDWKIYLDNVVRSHVYSQSDAKSILQSWADAINECKNSVNAPIDQIGIAMPGPFDYENGISLMFGQSKYDELYKMNIKVPLSKLIDIKPENIHFINDAAAFLQGEIYAQNLNHKKRILGITLGTGLGSAVWSQGEKAFDADLWNTPYHGLIFEEFLVTRWFVRKFKELTNIEVTGLRQLIEEHSNHPNFNSICEEYGLHLINFIDFFSQKYDSKDFIIGGNIAKALHFFLEKHQERIKPYTISTATLGEKAAIIGAASQFS